MLLERDHLLRGLEERVEAAASGRGGLVLVGGEAGVGKSAVVRELAARASGRPGQPVVLRWGACDDLTTPAPLGPLVEALPQVEQLAEAGLDRHLLFRRVLALLTDEPTLLVLEDVHWADVPTLDLLRFLGRRIDARPLLVVATYRTEELSVDDPLTLLLGDLGSAGAVHRVAVPPLTAAAVERLIAEAGSGLDPTLLFERTGGNAFYVTEVLAKAGSDLPESVRDAVLARVSRLSEPGREVLAAAAVLGHPSTLALLVEVSGQPPQAVDECVRTGLLVGDGTHWDFRHALARSAVADALPPARASELHAAALRRLRPTGDDRRLAFHAERCGDAAAVEEHAPRAAARAARLGAHREAAALYRAALGAHPASAARRAELWSALSYECYLVDRPEEALDATQHALELATTPTQVGEAERWMSRLCWFLGRNEDSEAHAARAIRTLEPEGPSPALAMAYSNESQLRMVSNDTEDAISWGTKALDLARRLGDHDTEIHAWNNVGTATAIAGDYHAGVAQLTRSLDLALARDAHEHVARAFTNLGSVAATSRHLADADRYLTTGIAYCTDRDLHSWLDYMQAWYARSLAEQGRSAEADEQLQALLSRPRLPTVVRIPALAVAGLLAARADQPDVASRVLAEAAALARGTGEPQRLVASAVAGAEAAWLADRVEAIPALLDGAWRATVHSPDEWDLGELAWWRSVAGLPRDGAGPIAEPFALMLDGAWSAAAARWEASGSPLWVAVCLARSPELAAARHALAVLDRLDAPAVRRAVLRDRQVAGLPVPRGPRPSSAGNDARLTAREREVLDLLAEGLTNADIAAALVLSPKTVGHHVSAILAKLGEPNRARAVAAAARRGLLPARERGDAGSPR